MRKSQTQKIGTVISDCLRELRIDRKLKEVSVVAGWEALMGKTVAVRTDKVYIRNRILYVQVTSSVLKNELIMMRQQIIDKLNENAGEKVVEGIVIK